MTICPPKRFCVCAKDGCNHTINLGLASVTCNLQKLQLLVNQTPLQYQST